MFNIANVTFLKCLIFITVLAPYQRRLFWWYCSDNLLHLRNNFFWVPEVPLPFLHLFLETLGSYSLLLARCRVSRICPTSKNPALRPEPFLTRTMNVDYRNGIAAFRRQETHFLAFCEVFLPRPILPGVGGPVVLNPVVVSQKAFPPGKGAEPEVGAKEKGGVYGPEDAFQLLLLTPFQSKLSGLFQVTSGQSTVGFAVSSRGRGENSITLGEDEVAACSLREGGGSE